MPERPSVRSSANREERYTRCSGTARCIQVYTGTGKATTITTHYCYWYKVGIHENNKFYNRFTTILRHAKGKKVKLKYSLLVGQAHARRE